MNKNQFNRIKYDVLKILLNLFKNANAGHIGASLSCIDILIYLFFCRMNSNDKFILSKGHAAAALYAILAKSGKIPMQMLDTFYKNATYLAAHPPCNKMVNGIIFGTGSLGHGLSLASGIALSNEFTNKNFKVYCLLSDGDCNEGSTWEAALFAAQRKLTNLTVIIDNNGLQGFGNCTDIINLEPFIDKWKSFNFDSVIAENGNCFDSLQSAFSQLDSFTNDKPKCIIARTIKGSGISFMENKMEWHYLSMTDDQYSAALKELEIFNA